MPIEADKTLEELFKSRLAQLKADSEYATGAISQHVRAISYGLVALIIPFVTAEPNKLPKLLEKNPRLALLCAAMGFAAVLADVLQHHFADLSARKELNRVVDNLNNKDLRVDHPTDFMMIAAGSPEANARKALYTIKIVLALGGVLSLAVILVNVFIS
jgi:hypothetical protein